jgi:hypothetical protein
MAPAHVANKAANAVTTLIEMQGRVGIAMRVIFWPPAFRSTLSNTQTKGSAHVQHWNVLFNPRNIRTR